MAIDVFVSYHTADCLDTAKKVVAKLEGQRLQCWCQYRDSGKDYPIQIEKAIKACKAFVVIVNKDSSRDVMSEIRLARKRKGLEILPLRMTRGDYPEGYEFLLGTYTYICGYNRSEDVVLDELYLRTQDAVNACPKTEKKVRYPDGSFYTGDVADGKCEGMGRLVWGSGAEWKGDIYEGGFRDNELNGRGKYVWSNGDTYEGEIVDGKCSGYGKYTWGRNTPWEGDVYEGHWRDGKRTGRGKYTWANGDIYEGDFVDDKRTGVGTYTYANGGVKSGRFRNGKFLG